MEKFDFWLPDYYAWKGWQPNQCFKKPPVGHFLGLQGTNVKGKAQRGWSEKAVRTSNSLSGRTFCKKITPKGFSLPAEFPRDIYEL